MNLEDERMLAISPLGGRPPEEKRDMFPFLASKNPKEV